MSSIYTRCVKSRLQMAAQLQRPEIQAKVTIRDAPFEAICNNALPNLRTVVPSMAQARRAGAGDRSDAGVQSQRFRTRLADLHAGRPPLGYHQSTHEEPIDPVLGYQPRVAQYNVDSNGTVSPCS